MKKFKNFGVMALVAGSAIASSMGTVTITAVASVAGYTALAVATTQTGLADAEARRATRSSSRSTFSRPSSAPAATPSPKPTPAPAQASSVNRATPATPATPASASKIGSNVRPATATRAVPATPRTMARATPPLNRTWHSTPAQRASNGSSIQPFLLGAAAGVGGAMLVNWMMSPSDTPAAPASTSATSASATEATSNQAVNTTAGSKMEIVKPAADFKRFEGSQIPKEYQEIMAKNNLSILPKEGDVVEYSKQIEVKGGAKINVDVAELPVLVVYLNKDGKPAEALFMPI